MARYAPLGDRLSRPRRASKRRNAREPVHAAAAGDTQVRARFCSALTFCRAPARAHGTIERVVSPGGIEAWLVRHSAVPIIAVEFCILGGADQDPADKPGIANMAASLLDEGAGPLTRSHSTNGSSAARIELQFHAGRDYLRGTLRTLKETLAMRLSMLCGWHSQRLDSIRRRSSASADRSSRNCGARASVLLTSASRKWWATAFPNHPYGQPGQRHARIGASHYDRGSAVLHGRADARRISR